MSDNPHSVPSAPIRVLIADDEALVRAGFRALVDSAPDLTVVGEAGTGSEAVRLTRQLRPDVVLMDIRMPVMDGLEAMRHIAADDTAGPHVLIVTTFDQDEHVFRALRTGAGGFILKDSPAESLIAAARAVAGGAAWLDPKVAPRVLEAFRTNVRPHLDETARVAELTDREHDVLRHMARGATNAEIADALIVSEATIKTHVGAVFSKLGVRDRAAAIVFAYDHGLVEPHPGVDHS
ncbi:MAG: response regulator [Stackebrandtia sp.]